MSRDAEDSVPLLKLQEEKSGGSAHHKSGDHEDDSIFIDLTKDEESQCWLSKPPETRPMSEMDQSELEELEERALEKLKTIGER